MILSAGYGACGRICSSVALDLMAEPVALSKTITTARRRRGMTSRGSIDVKDEPPLHDPIIFDPVVPIFRRASGGTKGRQENYASAKGSDKLTGIQLLISGGPSHCSKSRPHR
jgi:hypothetical protein